MRQLVPVALFLVACSGRSERSPLAESGECARVVNCQGACQVVTEWEESCDDAPEVAPLDADGACPLVCE